MNAQAAMAQMKPFFRFPFQDAQARRRFGVGWAVLLSGFIVPIVPGLITYGYALRILRATVEGESPSMPAWDDWPSFLSVGLRGWVVNLVFMLPGLALFFLGFALYLGMFFLIPLSSRAEAGRGDLVFALFFLAMGAMFLSMAMGSVLLALGTIPLPVSTAHFVAKDRLGAAFNVREWWPVLSANWLGYFISFVTAAGVLGIAYYAFVILYSTFVLACLGILLAVPIGFYASLLAASLFGEAYREGRGLVEASHGASPVEASG